MRKYYLLLLMLSASRKVHGSRPVHIDFGKFSGTTKTENHDLKGSKLPLCCVLSGAGVCLYFGLGKIITFQPYIVFCLCEPDYK